MIFLKILDNKKLKLKEALKRMGMKLILKIQIILFNRRYREKQLIAIMKKLI
jgi:hypothetical protein